MNVKRRTKKQSGVIMILAGFVMLIVAALVLGMLQLRVSEVQTLGNKLKQTMSQYIADAGVEHAIWYLRMYQQPEWEWGDPEYSGVVTFARDSAFAMTSTGKCWGTRLNSNYPNGIYYQEKLVTPEITVTSATPHLCYCDYLRNNTDTSDDVQILLTRNGGLSWSSVSTPANRSDAACTTAACTWTSQDAGALAGVASGDTIRLAFLQYSNGNLNDAGWYIDNVSVVSACPANACTTAPASPNFFDDMEGGIGNWEYLIEPNQSAFGTFDNASFPNDYPANSNNFYWVGFDPRFSATSEWIILGRGIVGTNSGKVEAKVSVHGGSAPYNVKIQYWKRIM